MRLQHRLIFYLCSFIPLHHSGNFLKNWYFLFKNYYILLYFKNSNTKTMRTIFFTLSLFFSIVVSAQNDKIYMHNGKVVEGNVVKVAEFTVVYKYANEDAEQTVGKYAVDKILYGKSGRE